MILSTTTKIGDIHKYENREKAPPDESGE